MRVFVYFNLHKRQLSIKALDGAAKGKVIAHADRVLIRGATFRVSEAGRQRVLKTGRKNVHAGVVGELEGVDGEATAALRKAYRSAADLLTDNWQASDRLYAKYAKAHGMRCGYNPRKADCFTREVKPWPFPEHGQQITAAGMVYLQAVDRSVWAFDPCDIPADY